MAGLIKERIPSEDGLLAVIEAVGTWRDLAIKLGVPIKEIDFLDKSKYSGVQTLKYWKDGKSGEKYPVTCTFLLEMVGEAYGRNIAREIEIKFARESKYTIDPSVRLSPSVQDDSVSRLTESQNTPIECHDTQIPVTQGEPTQAMSTTEERSQKVKEIFDMYKHGNMDLCLPRNPELENGFDHLMATLIFKLSSAKPQVISQIHSMVRNKYRWYIHGVRPVQLPKIPNTCEGLCDFIQEKSTPYEIHLVYHAVENLGCMELETALENYSEKLATLLREKLTSYKKRIVTIPYHKDKTHLACVLSKEDVLLSVVLHMKEYFAQYLQLDDAIFCGFQIACTVLFFSISIVDAAMLAPKVLSHLAELKRKFSVSHLIVFGCFVCDLEKATIELLSDGESVVSLKAEKNQLENELAAARSSHQTRLKKVTEETAKLEDELIRKSELEVRMINSIHELKAELKKLREEKAKIDESYLLSKNENTGLSGEVTELRENMDVEREKCEDLRKQLQNVSDNIDRTKKYSKHLEQSVDGFECILMNKEQLILQLNRQITDLQRALVSHQRTVDQKEVQIEQREEFIMQLRTQGYEMMEEIEKLETENKLLKDNANAIRHIMKSDVAEAESRNITASSQQPTTKDFKRSFGTKSRPSFPSQIDKESTTKVTARNDTTTAKVPLSSPGKTKLTPSFPSRIDKVSTTKGTARNIRTTASPTSPESKFSFSSQAAGKSRLADSGPSSPLGMLSGKTKAREKPNPPKSDHGFTPDQRSQSERPAGQRNTTKPVGRGRQPKGMSKDTITEDDQHSPDKQTFNNRGRDSPF